MQAKPSKGNSYCFIIFVFPEAVKSYFPHGCTPMRLSDLPANPDTGKSFSSAAQRQLSSLSPNDVLAPFPLHHRKIHGQHPATALHTIPALSGIYPEAGTIVRFHIFKSPVPIPGPNAV